MKKLKVMTVVGTRPEIIRLSRVIAKLEQHCDHILVHTGQNYDYELNEIFFEDLSIRKPDYFLDSVGETTAETIGNIISKSDTIIQKENPDAVLLYGDTNSCLSVISAKRRKVPIFHIEAGNRCFDQRVPEEINRKIVDHLSDINMPLTEQARDYLIQEGIPADRIIKIGSCMKEVLEFHSKEIKESKILQTLNVEKDNYFVVSAHREENVDDKDSLNNLLDSLNFICDKYKLPIIVSTHPRTKDRLENLNTNIKLNKLIKFIKPLGIFDYICLQKNSKCVISDSGTITEESSILNFPAIMIRNAHERPEGMDQGVLIMSGLRKQRVFEAIKASLNTKKISQPVVKDYNESNVSSKVLKIILSYIEFINREVWKK